LAVCLFIVIFIEELSLFLGHITMLLLYSFLAILEQRLSNPISLQAKILLILGWL
jgi:hypothetical protein